MNKPDDVTQEAWDDASMIAGQWCHPIHHDFQVLAQDIARAIMAAEKRGEEREREACAKVAEERDEDGAIWPDGYEIARFIRERGDAK